MTPVMRINHASPLCQFLAANADEIEVFKSPQIDNLSLIYSKHQPDDFIHVQHRGISDWYG